MNIWLQVTKDGGWHKYTARFADGYQAIKFIDSHPGHDFRELEDHPLATDDVPASADIVALLTLLYPLCEHGMDLSCCCGPNHFPDAEQELTMGLHLQDDWNDGLAADARGEW